MSVFQPHFYKTLMCLHAALHTARYEYLALCNTGLVTWLHVEYSVGLVGSTLAGEVTGVLSLQWQEYVQTSRKFSLVLSQLVTV